MMWSKFVLLMWKNALLQYRQPFSAMLEVIVVPVLCSAVLLMIRRMAPETKDARQYPPFCPVELPFMCDRLSSANLQEFAEHQGGSAKPLGKFDLAYSPTGNSAIDKSMGLFKLMINNVDSYANEKDMEEHFLTSQKTNSVFAAIVFDDKLKDGAELPDDAEVTIRFPGELKKINKDSAQKDWATNQLFSIMPFAGPRDYQKDFGAAPEYYEEGFLALQTMLTYFLIYGQLGATKLDDIKTTTNDRNRPAPTVKMQRFPHASWIIDPAEWLINSYIGVLLLMIFNCSVSKIVLNVAIEKERQLKEAMKIMGLPGWLHWTAWFVKWLICFLFIIAIIVIMFKIPCNDKGYSILTFANPLVVVLFLLLYACSCITFAFACSVFFSKANTAVCLAGILFLVTFFPFFVTKFQQGTTKMLTCLCMNSAMGFGFHVLLIFESNHEGIQWSNIWHSGISEDNLTLGYVMLMLIVDTFLHLFIALYVEAVFPGQYGVPRSWNYLFTSAYWKGQSPSKMTDPESATPKTDSKNLENEPDLERGVEIKNLRKVFKNKMAVNNLSLNMYKDQITVLLGHNGAGKTTTMSMLTGMFPPTSGTAAIEGHDIRTDMGGARSSLGLCPQHDILFDDLTVREHLIFFTKLKGFDKKEVDREVQTYIELLELVPKAKAKSSKLSGGMKRKLCVGIAFCGNSQVVMLDEPTAGMDPSSRRATWDLIEKQKGGRTVLLTTHFMDEADLLGDRIAIMAGGELQCCGSSFFLKKKYGTGYRLIIDKADNCDPDQITQTLQKYIPSIQIHSDAGSELTYLLAESEADVFGNMLRDLEEHSVILGVRSFGISLTTLEEVFMKVGTAVYNADDQLKKDTKTIANNETKLTINNHDQLLTGYLLIRNQFAAMCMKKFLSWRRNWIWLLGQFLVPIALLIISLVMMRISSTGGDLPKLSLSLESYDDPITLIETAAGAASADIHDSYAMLTDGKVENVASISDVMMNYTSSSKVKRRYIVGASFKDLDPTAGGSEVTAWFNNEPYHSPPLALGMALNSVYQYMLKKRIRFANHPLPFNAKTKMERLSFGDVVYKLSLPLAFGFSIVSAFYVIFYVRERVCKSKHLQLVSGVKVHVFWLCAFLCDFATFLAIAFGIIITIVCFQVDGFKTAEDIGRFSVILLYYGVALLPLIYIASFWFTVPSSALSLLATFFMMFGPMAYLFLTIFAASFPSVVAIVHWVLLIEPHYSMATGIRDTYATYTVNKMCKDIVKICTEKSPGSGANQCWDVACNVFEKCCGKDANNYFEWQSTGIGRNLCYSIGLGTTMFLLLLIKDYKCFSKLTTSFGGRVKAPVSVPDEDSDVAEEKRKFRETNVAQLQRDYAIVLRDMTKVYKTQTAVGNISLGIKKYECFGLLGANGAGKTTTFQMMTGELKITSGDAWINGFNVKTQLDKVQKHIGYCPQFDALLDDLTAKETLVMFALLRGVPRHECASLAEKLAGDFDFRPHLNKPIKHLSGGNKRKVSATVSLIGDPPVVFLDEPTTGMDPMTKRHFWNVLCRERDSGKSIVLTSHSMEECEALCTRLVIMVGGSFKCLGSVQHLKSKYAAAYTLTIKVKKTARQDAAEQVEKFVEKVFPSATLREKHEEMLTYHIADASMLWSEMFGILQQAKVELDIEDYSLGQSSLEQVFLSFTKTQKNK